MILFTILICFALQRYWRFDNEKLSPLFHAYISKSDTFFQKLGIKYPLLVVILFILPMLLVLWLCHILLKGLSFGSVNFVFSVIVLFFCVRLYNPRTALAHYFSASRQGEDQSAFYYGAAFLKDEHKPEKDLVNLARDITRKILTDADQRIFSVLFWYILLGLSGAVIYSVISSLAVKKNHPTLSTSTVQAAKKLHALLHWLPTRIVGVTYALVGHAIFGFAAWKKHLTDGLTASHKFACDVGLVALEQHPDHPASADIKENEQALGMVEGALLLWMVVIALCTLVSWVA